MSLKRLLFCLVVFFLSSLNTSFCGEVKKGIDDNIEKTQTVEVQTKVGTLVVQIHSNDNYDYLNKRLIKILSEDTKDLIEYFEWVPDDDIHVIVAGATHTSNGWATVFPALKIVINDIPPSGSSYLNSSGDWLKNLILHELVHIIHMSQSRGFVDFIDTIFGSVGRGMTGVVPRWFTEGVAVWAETKFTHDGRLRDEMMLYEARRIFLLPGQCDSINCLSVPGHYPYGHSPYWLGGMFMNFLEKMKPGAVSCMIKSNSRRLPFFLDWAFEECLDGMNMYMAFQAFRLDTLGKMRKMREQQTGPEDVAKLNVVSMSDHTPNWQRGSVLLKDKLYFATNDERIDELAVYDSKTKSFSQQRTNGILDQLFKFDADQEYFTVAEIPYQDDLPRRWTYIDGRQQAQKATPTSGGNVYYLNQLGQADYAFRYRYGMWELYRIKSDNKGDQKEKRLKKFKRGEQVLAPFINENQKLEYLTYEMKKKSFQYWRQGEGGKLKKVFQYEGRVQLLDRCGDWPVFRLDNSKLAYLDGDKLKQVNRSFAKDVINMKTSSQQVYYWLKSDPLNLYYENQDCKKVLSAKASVIKEGKLQEKVVKPSSTEAIPHAKVSSSNYYSIAHLMPQYWVASVYFGQRVTFYTLSTSVSDPADNLTLDLNADYYQEVKKMGGRYGLKYRLFGNWYMGGIYEKSYNISSISRLEEDQTSSGGYLATSTSLGRLSYRINASVLDVREKDFLSNRQAQRYSLTQSFVWKRTFSDDFFNRFRLSAEVYRQNTKGSDHFIGQNYFLDTSFYFASWFQTHLEASYGKMDKKGFASGAVFAGEFNRHEFLGLQTNAGFSNELARGRMQFDIRLLRNYSDMFLMPLYLIETRLLLGAELLKSDYVYLGDTFYANEQIQSVHAGLRFKTQAFYYIPITFDIFHTITKKPDGGDVKRSVFKMDAIVF